MKINSCPACGGPGAIQTAFDNKAMIYSIWIQCEKCGRRGPSFLTGIEPTKTSDSAEVAAIAWNSGIFQGDDKT